MQPDGERDLKRTDCRPFRAGSRGLVYPGLKPRAESFNPFGIREPLPNCPDYRVQVPGALLFPFYEPAVVA
jgi:hypothetical protein